MVGVESNLNRARNPSRSTRRSIGTDRKPEVVGGLLVTVEVWNGVAILPHGSDVMPIRGFSVRLYFPDGDPQGLKVVERTNWTGQGIAFPRLLLAKARSRDEVNRTGVYVLWERNEEADAPRIYIGQSDNVMTRLLSHDSEKEFWTDAATFTSKDAAFNSAHARFIESELIRLAKDIGRADLQNRNEPSAPPISEADRADAYRFLDDMLTCIEVLGVSAFRTPTDISSDGDLGEREFYLNVRGIRATARVASASQFIVLEGSQAHGSPTKSLQERPEFRGQVARRQALIDDGVFIKRGEHYVLSRDFVFSSPSAATTALTGRAPSPYIEWKTESGRTLGEVVRGDDA